MFKRRDWQDLKGQDSDDTTSSDESSASGDESEESPGPPSGASEDLTGSAEDTRLATARLQDLSEDDFSAAHSDGSESPDEEPDSEAEGADLAEQLHKWTQQGAAAIKGRPLRCRICPKALILNAAALQQHMASRQHKKNSKMLPQQGLDVISFAEHVKLHPVDGETYEERLQHLRQQQSEPLAANGPASITTIAGEQRQPQEGRRQKHKAHMHDKAKRKGAQNSMAQVDAVQATEQHLQRDAQRKRRPRPGKRQRRALYSQDGGVG